METIPVRNLYGAIEINGLPAGGQEALLDQMREDGNVEVYWSDPQLARVTRLRLLTDPGFPMYDVSYCYGVLKDGRTCRVSLPFHQLKKGGRSNRLGVAKADIVGWAKRENIYAKGLHILDDDVISTLD